MHKGASTRHLSYGAIIFLPQVWYSFHIKGRIGIGYT